MQENITEVRSCEFTISLIRLSKDLCTKKLNFHFRAQCTFPEPTMNPGALINVARYLGSLKFRVWEKMLNVVKYSEYLKNQICQSKISSTHSEVRSGNQ